ncbi:hypothetical protein OG782_37040 [Streptomyces sp. NBC_00876]|uniref:hypothetical protein n=1 Tax=Streptomyces sp. NBC_00876 TaxID=2975853 RepID=UPI00386E892E|nr:hypothetical protein OG782_37040 [Streptomyces sp. NBC_00876]
MSDSARRAESAAESAAEDGPQENLPFEDLPFVDEHSVLVKASAADVWRALARAYGGGSSMSSVTGVYGHLVAAEPRRSGGEPLAAGSTLPGFAVAESVPERLVRFTGRHRYSRYALVFALAERPGGTLLSARTYARFPGVAGRAYGRLVIGSGAHAALLTRQLYAVRRRAEGSAPAG